MGGHSESAECKRVNLEVKRYFMSIGKAVRLVIQAGSMAKGGEVFLLDMGQPVRIVELARQMIELSGLVPDRDVSIQFTGLRPGEKLYEELLIEPEHVLPTVHPRIFSSQEPCPESAVLEVELDLLEKAIADQDLEDALAVMCRLVPEYGLLEQSQLLESHSMLDDSSNFGLVN